MVSHERLAEILRVNQAGEYGAKRIYQGQLAVLRDNPVAPTIQHMAEQEEVHLQTFNRLMVEHNVRPTLLQPLWHVGGFVMGAVSALLGPKAAHACTIAVEDVIEGHYQRQLNELAGSNPDLEAIITQFQAEEMEHKSIAEEEGGREAVGYPLLYSVIRTITKSAIWVSTRI
jgi:3-demethoxyubiquinol 3-hydroxylase